MIGVVWLIALSMAQDPAEQGIVAAELACPQDPAAQTEDRIAELHVRYAELDEAGFDRATQGLALAIRCFTEAPAPATIARIHQAQALVAYFAGQRVAARRAMLAARVHDPIWTLDPEYFSEGHPYQDLWKNATVPGGSQPIGEADDLIWFVDGAQSTEAPVDRAFVFQVQRAGEITRTEYVFDVLDLPDFGQTPAAQGPKNPPIRTLAVSIQGVARSLSANQTVQGAGLSSQKAAGLGGGVSLGLRATPLSFLGIEVTGSSVGQADPVLQGSFGVDLGAAALLGATVPVGELQLFAAGRLGYLRDVAVFWSDGPGGVTQQLLAVSGPSVGAEVGLRGDTLDARLSVDQTLAQGGPYELKIGAAGGLQIAGPLALEIGLQTRFSKLDVRTDDALVVGERSDADLRVNMGLGVWF